MSSRPGRAPALVGRALQGRGPENERGVRGKSCPASSGLWAALPGQGGHGAARGADSRPVGTSKAKAPRAPRKGTWVIRQSCAVPHSAE